jgi:hypothetical protein
MSGRAIDVGLFAESLIYYDCILVNPTNQPQFASLIEWLQKEDAFEDFIAMVGDGTIKIYDYAFATSAIEKDGVYSIWNLQDPIQARTDTFEQRFLYHTSVESVLPAKSRHRRKIYEAFRGNVIEAHAEDFSSPVENARSDYKDSRRNSLILQAFVDELYRLKRLGHPPEVQVRVTPEETGDRHSIAWGIDFSELRRISGIELNFNAGTPLTASAHSNRLLWSAAQQNCDLYLPRPMSALVGDKLYESVEEVAKAGRIVEELKDKVEFPDVRNLVNSGELSFADVMAIRGNAQKFRSWLQTESERDRDAIIAYHHEVAKESGYTRGGRMALNLFGILGGGASGAYLGTVLGGPVGGAVGGVAGSAVAYLAELTAKIGADWKPVVFGDWMRDRIRESISKNKTE